MKKYHIIPHTADVRLKVEGSTEKDLFYAALEGMASIIRKEKCQSPFSEKTEIKLKSSDITSLLIDFLSDVLTASHTNQTVYYEADFLKLDHNELHAIIKGEKVEEFDEDIKAVTYHEANVQKNDAGNLESIIIFDI